MQIAYRTVDVRIADTRVARFSRASAPCQRVSRPVPVHASTPAAKQLKSQTAASKRHVAARIAVSDGAATSTATATLPSVLDTVIVGAGITGLVTAQALVSNHADAVKSFVITEARDRVGGNITTMQDDSYIWEEGPNSFQPNDSMLQAAVSSFRSEWMQQ